MRILIWNVRGCNKPFKQKEIKILLQTNKVDVAVLLETRVKSEKAKKIVSKMFRGWNNIHNYGYAGNGRIWINWDPRRVIVREIQGHEQAIHCEVMDVFSGQAHQLIAVYALNTNEQRKVLWDFLSTQCQQSQGPLLVGGDFNAMLNYEDRANGNVVTQAEVEDFRRCVEDNELQEVRAVGPQFTWCNNQEGEDRIWSNIDRCFANIQWLSGFSSVVVERLTKGVSDHCPQLISFDTVRPQRSLFKFFNVLADHEQFEQMIRENWTSTESGSTLRGVWRKCNNLKHPLKQLNTRCFAKTADRVEGIRQKLQVTQQLIQQGSTNLLQEEKFLTAELEKWSKIEESIWQQKARIDWIHLGDSNTNFFMPL